jgi:hypothetical protein
MPSKHFVQFLTVSTGFGPAVYMHLVPVEDAETVREATSLFLTGDHDCSMGQSDDDKKIETLLSKYPSVQIVGEDTYEDEVTLPEGDSIVKVVTRYICA